MSMTNKIRALIVDDSAVVRQMLQSILSEQADIEVIATAADPYFAIEKMRGNWPDVIILDVEMPRMDGISFLKKIMSSRPTPVVICSSFSARGVNTTLEALAAGAVSNVIKPAVGLKVFLQSSKAQIIDAVRVAARSKVNLLTISESSLQPKRQVKVLGSQREALNLVAIGASTGGTVAIERILTGLPVDCPGIVIVQHMPEGYTAAFAQRLNSMCAIEVREAQDGDIVKDGLALIAPGGKHLTVVRQGGHYVAKVKAGPAVNRHCPSVDVLFRSIAACVNINAAGFILTGMGNDGAKGIAEMRRAGCVTYAQNEESCTIFGMPKEAIKAGGIQHIIALEEMADTIVSHQAH